jgi:hypothetical protein
VILSPSSRLTAEEYKEACKPSFGFDKILTEKRRSAARWRKCIRCRAGASFRRATFSACSNAAAATSTRNSRKSACPIPTGSIQRLEEPGRPDLKQSNRGPGTGLRVSIPVLNIHKTRLNDPYMWFMGTNDQPGDYRHSGCSGCHVIYANDREPRHSLTYAKFGRDGETDTVDPTIREKLRMAAGREKARGRP